MSFVVTALAFLLISTRQASTPQVSALRPQYPATLHGVEDVIVASYVVGIDGSVRDVKILTQRPNQAMADATVAAVQQWHLRPLMMKGVLQERQETRSFFFTPPDGTPLNLGVSRSQNARIRDAGSTVSIASGSEWLLSIAMFGDFELTGEVRLAEGSIASLLVRAWADLGQKRSGRDEAYRVALGGDPQRPAGTVTGDRLSATTKSYDAEAAEAYRSGLSSWQPLKVECADRSLRVTLGGRLVTDAELLDGVVGHLGFEVSKGSIEYRTMRVVRQDRYRESVPLEVLFPYVYSSQDGAQTAAEPVLKRGPKAEYTLKAMRQRSAGMVALQAIVETDGSIGAVQVTRSLNEELDASAVRAVKKWFFEPAKVEGQPVRCLIDVELTFSPS
ncbi:MAG TPA: TonB family protein [Vicinamibacterales bacterium]